jgi:hypothetical protein
MNNNDKPGHSAGDSEGGDPPSLAGIIFLFLGAVFALLAALNIFFFEFGPPLVFGIGAGVSMLIGTQLLKK